MSCSTPKTWPQDSQNPPPCAPCHLIILVLQKEESDSLDTTWHYKWQLRSYYKATKSQTRTLLFHKNTEDKRKTTTMSKSTLKTLLFVVLLVAMNTDSALGLARVLNRVRTNTIWGLRLKSNQSQHTNSLLPAQKTSEASVDQSSPILPEPSFNSDSYRQEMVDLVYQRNVQRMNRE